MPPPGPENQPANNPPPGGQPPQDQAPHTQAPHAQAPQHNPWQQPAPGGPAPYGAGQPGPYGAPSPYSGGPQGGPWGAPQGGPWGAPQPPRPLSGLAVTALVFALVLWPVGLILGLVALRRTGRNGTHRGRALAIASVAVSSVSGAIVVALVAIGLAVDGDRKDVFALSVGDCFNESSLVGLAAGETTEELSDVATVPCEGPHDTEVFATIQLDEGDYPGVEAIAERAARECTALIQPYVLDTWLLTEDMASYYLHPTQTSWRFGDREILCVVGPSSPDGVLDSSIRGEAADYTADQLTYLELTADLETTLSLEPVSEDLAENAEWAGRMADDAATEAAALRAAAWEADIAGQVEALAAAREETAGVWAEMAESTADEGTFWTLYTQGFDSLGVDQEIEVRELLGLSTSVATSMG